MNSTKKVLVCAFTQESNSFNPIIMSLSNFSHYSIEVSGNSCDVGALSYLSSQNVDCIYGIAMHARSGGHISDETVEFFLNDTLGRIKNADNLDFSSVLYFNFVFSIISSLDSLIHYFLLICFFLLCLMYF